MNMSNTLSYRNFELYVTVNGVFGGNRYFLAKHPEAFSTSDGWSHVEYAGIPYWTPENKSNVYPSPTFMYVSDSRYFALQSRGFIRVEDVSLSYTFNQSWIKAAKISSMKIFFSARNVFTLSHWYGGDPEAGVRFLEAFPVPSIYSIGANISL